MMLRHTSLLLLLAIIVPARADSGWTLRTADFSEQSVSFDALDAQGVQVTPAGGQQTKITFDDLLSLERSEAPRGGQEPFAFHTLGGDRIHGQPIAVKGENLSWRSGSLGEVVIPLKQARLMVRAGKSPDAGDSPRTEDLVMLANGDSLKGIVMDITGEKLAVQVNNAPVVVPLESVSQVHFALAGQPRKPEGRAFRVRLSDGSSVTATAARFAGQEMELTLIDDSKRSLAISAVAGVEQINGPVTWLSSQAPEATTQTPFFGSIAWPTRIDQTVGGRPITFGGKTFARGIGVHAYSRIDFALDGSHEAFRTQYAVAQEEKRQYADVTVRIRVDDKVVHEEANVRAEKLSPVVTVELPKGAKKLTLEVDYGEANDTQDRLNWIEPALLKKKPSSP